MRECNKATGSPIPQTTPATNDSRLPAWKHHLLRVNASSALCWLAAHFALIRAHCAGSFPPTGPPVLQSGGVDTWFAAALDAAKSIIAGDLCPAYLRLFREIPCRPLSLPGRLCPPYKLICSLSGGAFTSHSASSDPSTAFRGTKYCTARCQTAGESSCISLNASHSAFCGVRV